MNCCNITNVKDDRIDLDENILNDEIQYSLDIGKAGLDIDKVLKENPDYGKYYEIIKEKEKEKEEKKFDLCNFIKNNIELILLILIIMLVIK